MFGLQRIGPKAKAAVPALIKALKSKNNWFRQWVAGALGAIGPEAKAAVPALVELLKDEQQEVREAAAEALEKINTPEAQKALKDYEQKPKKL